MAFSDKNPGGLPNHRLDGPAIDPPPGIESNFDDPPNQNSLALGIIITGVVLTSIFAVIRIASRIIVKKLRIADVLGILSLGIYYAFTQVFFELINTYGFWINMWNLRLRDIPVFNKIYFRGLLLYHTEIMILKAAILFDWLEIFVPRGTRTWFWWTSYSIMIIHTLFYLTMIVIELTACRPLERKWNPLIEGKCMNTRNLFLARSAINVTFDIVIFILPQRLLWKLQMSPKKRRAVSAIFSVGILCCVAAGLRMNNSVDIDRTRDKTYAFAGLALSCFVEATCGLIILSAPCILQVKNFLKPQTLTSSVPSWTNRYSRRNKRDPDASIMLNTNANDNQADTNWDDRSYRKIDDSAVVPLEDIRPSPEGYVSPVLPTAYSRGPIPHEALATSRRTDTNPEQAGR